jgi:hypothetical protein
MVRDEKKNLGCLIADEHIDGNKMPRKVAPGGAFL